MAYKIEYGQRFTKTEFQERTRGIGKHIKTLVVIAMILFTIYFANAGKLQDALIPGNTQATMQAFEKLTEDLRDGANLKSAITAFCHEIIVNANIS